MTPFHPDPDSLAVVVIIDRASSAVVRNNSGLKESGVSLGHSLWPTGRRPMLCCVILLLEPSHSGRTGYLRRRRIQSLDTNSNAKIVRAAKHRNYNYGRPVRATMSWFGSAVDDDGALILI
ncbi:hypothetical protein PoB_001249100 [Plakobranchus ocellatus]|uniref:Uncharacterized protein n=1 Tax=Plakobranchus ocellatus TaxID=259542 RepID=A0AAV3YFA1_9GAST|nr:hypothetical protein PoB_001249100 [Plakobranchus ocellatus]